MDRKRLSTIQNVLDDAVKNAEFVGANLLVWQNDTEEFYCESGFADKEAKKRMQRDTLFHLYSMSKPITGAAAMILLERGMIDLCDPVSRYIPAYKAVKRWDGNQFVSTAREITIKDLLGMVSGLPYGFAGANHPVINAVGEAIYLPNASTVEVAAKLAECGIMAEPGEAFGYGTSADVMGAVIEVASGMKFSAFLQKEIFEPLHMTDTGFFISPDKIERLCKIYTCENGNAAEYTENHLNIAHLPITPPMFESGGAGLISTIDDYMKFGSMLLRGGVTPEGKQILSRKTIEFFTSSQLTQSQQKALESSWYGLTGYSYGNFLRVMENPGQAMMNGTIGEYGWDGWLGTYFCNSPKDNLTFLMMMQKVDTGTHRVTRQLRNICMASLD